MNTSDDYLNLVVSHEPKVLQAHINRITLSGAISELRQEVYAIYTDVGTVAEVINTELPNDEEEDQQAKKGVHKMIDALQYALLLIDKRELLQKELQDNEAFLEASGIKLPPRATETVEGM